jgi:glycosyltransferase involved in cell wall biosynthesis
MRIGIDVRLWNQTGVGRYVRNLISEISKIDSKNEFILFARKADLKDIQTIVDNDKFTIIEADYRWHSLSEQTFFVKLLYGKKLDLVHFPYFSVPVLYRKPYVVTIHDLIIDHFATGEATTYPAGIYYIKRFMYKVVMSNVARNANAIIVPTKATKHELMSHYKVAESRIKVTWEAGFKVTGNDKEQKQLDKKKYFLYVGNAYPHKNLPRLISAFAELQKDTKEHLFLFLVGKEDFFYKKLKRKVKNMQNIIFYENIDDPALSDLYKNAHAIIIPSLMEGFGLPAVEAMRYGTLILCSDIPSLNEICGRSAYYFDPYNIGNIKEVLKNSLHLDKTTLLHRKEALKERYRLFSWDTMARDTLRTYENCVGL